MSESNLIEIGANPADIARNRATGAGVIDDPYPVYDRLRETGPVHEGPISRAFGVDGMTDPLWQTRPQFGAYDWETVDTILRDAETYSSESYQEILGVTIGRSMIQMDGREHRRSRALVQPAFTRKEMEGWRVRWVQTTVDRILDEIIERREPVDLYDAICSKVPVFTIASTPAQSRGASSSYRRRARRPRRLARPA